MTVVYADSTLSAFEPTDPTISGTWSTQWIGFTEARSVDEWFYRALDPVRRFADLDENWDGYGSPPISNRAVETTVLLLARFAREAFRIPVPEIAPVSGGGLHLEFAAGGRGLEIEILPDASVEVLLSDGEEDVEVSGRAESLDVPAASSWLIEGTF